MKTRVRSFPAFDSAASFISTKAGSAQKPQAATLGDIQDGVGFRRARLQALGSAAELTKNSIEMDFATADRPSFIDVWGEQTHVRVLGNAAAGNSDTNICYTRFEVQF